MEKKEKTESGPANMDLPKNIYGDASAKGERRPLDSDRELRNKHNNEPTRWPENLLQAKIGSFAIRPPTGSQSCAAAQPTLPEMPQSSIGTSPYVLPVGERRVPIRMTSLARKSLPKVPSFGDDDETATQSKPNAATGCRAGGAAIVCEQADIEALMPKLCHSDYYTKPSIQELAAKERAEPGFCRRVKDFVVGRDGFGSIKFFGETDVRRLDLESLVQFDNCKGMVYVDEREKPPVGQGLNKSAEVTLLNIKCFNKMTGLQYARGPSIEKYTQMLKIKAKDQGAEFVSYDPVKGEWKFRVDHFNEYKLDDDGADIEALMPKLCHSDYYTKPSIQELAAKERAETGFCRRVKDFVVGRDGFGSIKFFGETDVRRLDLESLVQFDNCKGMVYVDEREKPPVGQGLNKSAEVTLLNIKCFNKMTGLQYARGPSIEKYTQMLKRKAKDQGAEFVSYDPVKGEWKFRVDHFNEYKLDDDGADIEALMPKLCHSDYYTKPSIQELAAKERAETGFCRRVKDFVVGRDGFGSIKFFGETDVRRLDLESLVQFDNCKGMVYVDESEKPPVGQGLNKRAEVTLLNIKFFNKRTGQQYTGGPSIEKYTEMLKRKAKDQGAEFVSYDPVKGEWKFRVDHFSEYKLGDED